MKNITCLFELEEHCGVLQPKDPYKLGRTIESSQKEKYSSTHTILFNKGRYFETSFSNLQIANEVAELINLPIQYNNMICGNWNKLEDFVVAMNCLGIYVKIDIDWI